MRCQTLRSVGAGALVFALVTGGAAVVILSVTIGLLATLRVAYTSTVDHPSMSRSLDTRFADHLLFPHSFVKAVKADSSATNVEPVPVHPPVLPVSAPESSDGRPPGHLPPPGEASAQPDVATSAGQSYAEGPNSGTPAGYIAASSPASSSPTPSEPATSGRDSASFAIMATTRAAAPPPPADREGISPDALSTVIRATDMAEDPEFVAHGPAAPMPPPETATTPAIEAPQSGPSISANVAGVPAGPRPNDFDPPTAAPRTAPGATLSAPPSGRQIAKRHAPVRMVKHVHRTSPVPAVAAAEDAEVPLFDPFQPVPSQPAVTPPAATSTSARKRSP